jgi:lysophospholipase L1-like esterase
MGSSKGNSYRKDLYDQLTASSARVQYLGSLKAGSFEQNSHEGWSAFPIAQISAKADHALKLQPNIVLLLAGTNDMWSQPKGAPEHLQTLAEKVVKTVPDTALIIGTIPPLGGPLGMWVSKTAGNGAVGQFNATIPNVAKAVADKGGKVVFADRSAVKLDDLKDGIHPNDKEYTIMANGWFNAIEEAASKGWIKT